MWNEKRRFRILLAAGFIVTVSLSRRAPGHEGSFVVSRDDATPPRLYVNGPHQLLDGSDCIGLIRGDDRLTGFWINDVPQFQTLPEDGAVRGRRRLLSGHRLALRLLHSDKGFCLLEPSSFKPVLAKDGDTYPFFTEERGDFMINMIPRVDHSGIARATFQFVDLAGLHADSAPFSLCFRADFAQEIVRSVAALNSGLQSPSLRMTIAAAGWMAVRKAAPAKSSGARDADGHLHGASRPLVAPKTYREAVEEYYSRLHAIDTWIGVNQYNFVPADADALGELALLIPDLTAAPTSGVPVGERERLNQSAADVAAACRALTISANWSDSIAVREHYDTLSKLFTQFDAFVPRLFRCPMGCEGQKTYPKADPCPVCGMKLADTRAHMDHKPRHGGTFFMAPDYRHHLEGVLAAPREFRVYFYDEFTKAISAEGLDARAEAWKSGANESQALVLRPTDSKEYQTVIVPASIGFPLRIKLFVDFQDGQGPQVFDFEFNEIRP